MAWLLNIILFLVSAIPLHIALRIFGARTNIIKTAVIVFISSIIILYLQTIFNFGGFLAFILMFFIYKFAFQIGWWKSFFAWILQFVILAIFIFAAFVLGFGWIMI